MSDGHKMFIVDSCTKSMLSQIVVIDEIWWIVMRVKDELRARRPQSAAADCWDLIRASSEKEPCPVCL